MDTTKDRDQGFVITERNGIVENRHQVHAAIVDSTGTLLFSIGDPSRMTLIRSSVKPVQALAVLETGALEQYGFDDKDLALMCASHNAEDRHVERARSMLAKIQATEGNLRCGPHDALTKEVERHWLRQDFAPTPICNNCSGKHAGMLAGAPMIGARVENYHLPDHPMQKRVKSTVAELCDVRPEDIHWAIDGCNLPAPALSLQALAGMNATFAGAADSENNHAVNGHSPLERTQALNRIYRAMAKHPELVAGQTRFCTELMQAYQGALVGKVGAEAVYGVAVRQSSRTRELGATGAIGIGIKIEDGNRDVAYSVVVEILEQLKIGSEEQREKLEAFHKRKVTNTAGVTAGNVWYAFDVLASGSISQSRT